MPLKYKILLGIQIQNQQLNTTGRPCLNIYQLSNGAIAAHYTYKKIHRDQQNA